MNKFILLVATLFVGAVIASPDCELVFQYSNIQIYANYSGVSALNSSRDIYDITFYNTQSDTPYPNDYSNRSVDVHAVSIADQGVDDDESFVAPAHIDFHPMAGGAYKTVSVSIPRPGKNGKCYSFIVYYTRQAVRHHFKANFLFIATSAVNTVRQVEEEHSLAARTCGASTVTLPWNNVTNWFTASYGDDYGNSGYCAIAQTVVNLTYTITPQYWPVGMTSPNGANMYVGNSLAPSRSFEFVIDCSDDTTNDWATVVATWKCPGSSTVYSIQKTGMLVVCSNQKRTIGAKMNNAQTVESSSVNSSLKTNSAIAIASAGVAVAAVALIAAFVIVRRKKVEQMI